MAFFHGTAVTARSTAAPSPHTIRHTIEPTKLCCSNVVGVPGVVHGVYKPSRLRAVAENIEEGAGRESARCVAMDDFGGTLRRLGDSE